MCQFPNNTETTFDEAYWQAVEAEEREVVLAEMAAQADVEYLHLIMAGGK